MSSSLLIYIPIAAFSVIFIHFLALLIGLPEFLRPLTWFGWLGDWMIRLYDLLGTIIGYCWYCGMYAAAWFQNVVVERFIPALKQTVIDLGSGLEKFFNVSVLFYAIKDQIYDFWNAYYPQIIQGTVAAVLLVAGIVMVYIAWGNCKKERSEVYKNARATDDDDHGQGEKENGNKRKIKIVN